MSMFRDDEWATAEETHLAPGPAAYSRNGNGADKSADRTQPAEPPRERLPALTAAEWVAVAPPAAVLILAASGAVLAVVFMAILSKVSGGTPD